MSDESSATGKKSKKQDYAEIGFELGNLEFEAKGRSTVVERMFRLLLEKIETGKLVATLRLQDEEEEEEEEEFPEEEKYIEPDSSPILESDQQQDADDGSIPSEAYLDPPPVWESLDIDSPPISDPEREDLDEN
jgi:hypothetical protein